MRRGSCGPHGAHAVQRAEACRKRRSPPSTPWVGVHNAALPDPMRTLVPHRVGMDTDSLPPRLILRGQALAAGHDDAEIRRLRRRGDWLVLQRGAYLTSAPAGPREEHLLAVRATLAGLRVAAIVSHASAAAVHGLPLWRVPLGQVHITRQPPARSARETRLRSHVARLSPRDVVTIGSMAVTAPARTVVDLASTLPFEPALVLADAALHDGRTTPAELRAVASDLRGTRGSRAAHRVVAAADGRSESIGESRSRALMITAGLPVPDLQVEVRGFDGRLLGRCDFGWRSNRLLGEFNGRVKYGRLLRPGQHPGDAVFAEKRREDDLRFERWDMTRWVWADLDAPAGLTARLERALERGAR